MVTLKMDKPSYMALTGTMNLGIGLIAYFTHGAAWIVFMIAGANILLAWLAAETGNTATTVTGTIPTSTTQISLKQMRRIVDWTMRVRPVRITLL
jgi:uncharacterized membrane protein